jgi:hypothetical protein
MDADLSVFEFLDRLQDDIAGRLAADEFFAHIPVGAQHKGVIADDIAQALQTLAGDGTEAGAGVIVMMPSRTVPHPNIPGPSYDLTITIRAMEIPFINRAEGGTNRTATAISLRIEHLLHQLTLSGVVLTAQRVGGLQDADGGVACDVDISFRYGLPAALRVQAPGIALAGSLLTLSCATSGATIRYTLDGSYPGLDAEAYSVPVTLTDGQTIRAVAAKAGMQESAISETTYTAT